MEPGQAAPTLNRGPSAWTVTLLALAACLLVAGIQAHSDYVGPLTAVLGVAAVASGIAVAQASEDTSISAAFIVAMLAAAFLGSASACAVCLLGELPAAWRRRTHPILISSNLVVAIGPTLLAANLIRVLAPANRASVGFYLVYGAVVVGAMVLSFAMISEYHRFLRVRERWSLRTALAYAPSVAINITLAVAGAALYVELGLAGIIFALAAVGAFAYMAHLLARARTRAEQYVSLSWGVLGGLLRALDLRDGRAARHAAAVARFAADIARDVGMSTEEVELAHTAGLLHDIGHFALSDRVAERGRTLTTEDWEAIYQHPELGADMLRDLGMYGPVADIVRAHHERVDGRGYPSGLVAEEIPEIAKIIAVAEVYDTLTASDTYRTPMSSFEALTELRRVAGSQLDVRYVEVLAALLSGEGMAYRHADAADFDAELAMERRIREAASA